VDYQYRISANDEYLYFSAEKSAFPLEVMGYDFVVTM
jgi:hypothetical protein